MQNETATQWAREKAVKVNRNHTNDHAAWLTWVYLTMSVLMGLIKPSTGKVNYRGGLVPTTLRYNNGQALYSNPAKPVETLLHWHNRVIREMRADLNAAFKADYPAVFTLEIHALMYSEIERENLYRKPLDGKTIKRQCMAYEAEAYSSKGMPVLKKVLRNRRYTTHVQPSGKPQYFGGQNPFNPELSADNHKLYENTYSHEVFRQWALRSMSIEQSIGKADLDKPWFNKAVSKPIGNVDRDLPWFSGKVLTASAVDNWKKYLGSRLVERDSEFVDIPLYSKKSAELRVSAKRFDLYESQRRGKETVWFASTIWLYRLPKRFLQTDIDGQSTVKTGQYYGFHMGSKRQAARRVDTVETRLAVENTITESIAKRILAKRQAAIEANK